MFIDLLIKLIVVLLPTQFGLHFWPDFSRVAGVKIDYLSPTIYFVDLLLVLLTVLTLPQVIALLKKHLFLCFSILIFIIINTLFAQSPLNTLFWWIRLLLYIFTFLSLRTRHLSWKTIETPLLLSSILVISIQILQTIFQSSLGGPLYLLGERAYTISTPGIARLNFFGYDFVRAPSVFSHPNSLAGYLLIVYYLFSLNATKKWYRIVPFLGIVMSLSKSALLTLFLLIINTRPVILISLSIIITVLEPSLLVYRTTWQSVSDRLFFFPYLQKILRQHPFLGTGYGGFIPALGEALPGSFLTPSKLQPIHNLFYLYLSELGLFGSLLFLLVFVKNKILQSVSNPQTQQLVGIILLSGCFDHFFWTLPQNKLIVIFALSILL
ncbi:MAG TPA: hypothetical protein PLI45_03260 [Candidatus Woesebacteria bacterium]|nr:hypothetical protein [Candidatus Woesebacteria bacterium]